MVVAKIDFTKIKIPNLYDTIMIPYRKVIFLHFFLLKIGENDTIKGR